MSLLQKELEFWLASLPAIGAIKIQELLKYFKTEEQIFKAGENELRQVSRITEKDVACIISNRNIDTIKKYCVLSICSFSAWQPSEREEDFYCYCRGKKLYSLWKRSCKMVCKRIGKSWDTGY